MISNVVAFGLIGMAAAAYAPPAYEAASSSSSAPVAPVYGASTSSAPVAPVYSAPATTSAPVAPVYSAPASSSSSSTYACNPAHQYPNGQVCTEVSGTLCLVTPSTSSSAPVYEATTYVTYCSEATTLTWYSSTIPVPHPTTLTLTHVAKPTYSVDIPITRTSAAPVWTTSATSATPVAPVYETPAASSPASPVAPVYSAPVYPVSNSTKPAATTGGSYPSSPVSYTGAGARTAVGASFAGVAAVLAFFL